MALLAIGCLPSPAVRADELACGRADIVVRGASAKELALACAAVGEALDFLAPAGLTLAHGPAIKLVDLLPGNDAKHALGRYDAGRDVVELMDYRAALAASDCETPAFKVPMSRALWKSYVAHEVAHAALRAHDPNRSLTLAQHEYVAAVVQLGTLSEAIRDEILLRYDDLPAFGAATEISDLYYYMAPCAFAVKAYRHYLRPGNGPAFITRLVSSPVRRP